MTTRTVAICALCFMSALFVFGIAGYFIFLSRIKTKKTAIKLKRQMKKNAMWWPFCWAAWLVIFFLRWNAARTLGNDGLRPVIPCRSHIDRTSAS